MNGSHLPGDALGTQTAISRVALSLDSMLVNGLQHGVLIAWEDQGLSRHVRSLFESQLSILEEQLTESRSIDSPEVREAFDRLRETSRSLTAVAENLESFRQLELGRVVELASRVALLRRAFRGEVRSLEVACRTPTSFDKARPAYLEEAVSRSIDNLARNYEEAWEAARAGGTTPGRTPSCRP